MRFPSVVPWRADKARFQLQSSEELCREIRVENKLQDGAGNLVSIKQSAEVDAAIGAGNLRAAVAGDLTGRDGISN